ncbi:hypothetical protein [Massilia sp. BKSP1R2A-1]|uniref:hypothetical protein n=1 Tax=Massilia sp. BKSP1R2A-1 TaxID=3422595 RepID=UPI003D34CB00
MGIRERILERADLAALRAARDIDGLAAALNVEGLLAPQQRFVTARAVMSGCPSGVAILQKLEAAASQNCAVAWAVKFLGQEAGLDIGDAFAQQMCDQLAAGGVITAGEAAELKALALHPLIVTRDQVNEAMFNPDGSEK